MIPLSNQNENTFFCSKQKLSIAEVCCDIISAMKKNATLRRLSNATTEEERNRVMMEIRQARDLLVAPIDTLTDAQVEMRRAAIQISQEHERQLQMRDREEEIDETSATREVEGRARPPGDLEYNIRAGDVVVYSGAAGRTIDLYQDYPRGIVVGFSAEYVSIRVADDSIVRRVYRNVRTLRRPGEIEHRARWRNWGYDDA